MKGSFVKNAGVLAVGVILAKVLGAVYRIPLTSMIGAEGMGLYQFVYPVFALLLTLSGGAVPTAVGIAVSEKASVGDEEGARRAFATALKLSVLIGTTGTLLLLVLAYPVSLLQSADAVYGHLAIAPAILVVTLVSAFRGWFTGHNELRPSAISQITEGVVKLAVGLSLTSFLSRFGVKFAVVGALLGVVASEVVTLLVMTIAFFIKDKSLPRVRLRDEKATVDRLKSVALPLVLCGTILPASQLLDSLLVVNLLKWGGFGDATATYGIWSGVVTPLINLPVMVCITLGVAVTPQMVEGREKRDVDFVTEKANVVNKLTLMLGVPFVILYFFMADGFVGLLYPRLTEEQTRLAVTLLRVSCISVLGLSVFQIHSAILQGLGRAKTPVYILAACMGIKLVLTLILTPTTGIVGSAVASVVGYALAGVASAVYFAFFAKPDPQYVKNAGLITLCGVIMGTVAFATARLQTSVVAITLVGAAASAVYMLALLALRVFSEEELKSLPLSAVWTKLDRKINGGTNGT